MQVQEPNKTKNANCALGDQILRKHDASTDVPVKYWSGETNLHGIIAWTMKTRSGAYFDTISRNLKESNANVAQFGVKLTRAEPVKLGTPILKEQQDLVSGVLVAFCAFCTPLQCTP